MIRTQSSLSLLLAAALVAALTACATPPLAPSAGAATGELVTLVVADEIFPGMDPATTRALALSLPQRGTLELTATWQDPENTVVIFLTDARCRSLDLLGTSACRERSAQTHDTKGGEERTGYREANGSYQLWVVNRGPRADTVAVTARLTYHEGDRSSPERGERPHPRDPVTY